MTCIAICDDKKEWLSAIENACKSYFDRHSNVKAEIVSFDDPKKFLDYMEAGGKIRLALLDIVMPGVSGIDVAKRIRERGDETEIVFLSTSNEWGMQGYQVKAMDYILKPFGQEEFDATLDKVLKVIKAPPSKKLMVNGENGKIIFVEVEKILYVETQRNCRVLHCEDGDVMEMKRTLQALTDDLEHLYPDQFMSPLRGYLINLNAVQEISMDGIRMKDGSLVFIKSNTYRKLRDFYFEWAFEKGEK